MKVIKEFIAKRRLTKKEWILFSIWIIIICIVFTEKVVKEVSAKLTRLDEEITLTQGKLDRFRTISEYKDTIEETYNNVIPGLRTINDFETLFREIESVNKAVDLNILTVKPLTSKDEGLYKIYSLKIEARDRVLTLMRFLDILTNTLRGVGIERLEVYSQSEKEPPKINMLINAVGILE